MKNLGTVGVVVLLVVIAFILGYSLKSEDKITEYDKLSVIECDKLSENFDKEVMDGDPFLYYPFGETEDRFVVGGILTKIEDMPGYSMSGDIRTYKLHFKGKDYESYLIYSTFIDNVLPYQINNFYKFDLRDIRPSGEHDGEFIDREMNKITNIIC